MNSIDNQAWAKKRLEKLRMVGYVGTQFCAVLGSLLVFQLTGSAAWAGLALGMEWIPKLLMYLGGGSWAQRLGSRRAHVGSEVGKLVALGLIWLCAAGMAGPWALVAAGALCQCSNAVSNIVFEMSVTKWWDSLDRPEGHAAMMQSDNWACFAALGMGWAWGSALGMASVAVAIGLASSCWAFASVGRLHAKADEHGVAKVQGLWTKIIEDLREVGKKPLMGFAVSGLLLGIPTALAFASLVFTLDKASPGASSDAKLISALLLGRVALAIGLMALGRRFSAASSAGAFWIALGALGLGAAWACVASSVWEVAACLALLSCSGLFYTPRLRARRQELLGRWVPEASRSGATGAMISVEACSYLGAAALMWGFNGDWAGAAVAAACLAAVGIGLGFCFWTAPERD